MGGRLWPPHPRPYRRVTAASAPARKHHSIMFSRVRLVHEFSRFVVRIKHVVPAQDDSVMRDSFRVLAHQIQRLPCVEMGKRHQSRSEEHTSELQSLRHL